MAAVDMETAGEIPATPEAPWRFTFYEHPENIPGSAQKRFQWCISPEALHLLKNACVENASVLIVTVDEKRRERRQVVPLSDMQALLQFNEPGQHTVYAIVVNSKAINEKSLSQFYLSLERPYTYKHQVFYYGGQDLTRGAIQEVTFETRNVVVGVDANEFATSLPPALEWWINVGHDTDSYDTCSMRRRMIFAFTIKPFIAIVVAFMVAVLWVASLVYALWLSCVCLRSGIAWKEFLGGNKSPTASVNDHSWLTHDTRGKIRPHGNKLSFLLPWVQIKLHLFVFAALLVVVMFHGEEHFNVIVTCIWLVTLLGYLVAMTVKDMPPAPKKSEPDVPRQVPDVPLENPSRARIERQYSDVVCGDPATQRARTPQFTLSNPRPALTHWFHDLKMNWCKPYAQK